MRKIIILFSITFLLCLNSYAQSEYTIIDDTTMSGGIIDLPPQEMIYEPVAPEQFPDIIIDVYEEIGGENAWETGKEYTFNVDFDNLFADKDVKLYEILTDCTCERATWLPNTVAPGGKRTINVWVRAMEPNPKNSYLKLLVSDPDGKTGLATQKIILKFNSDPDTE